MNRITNFVSTAVLFFCVLPLLAQANSNSYFDIVKQREFFFDSIFNTDLSNDKKVAFNKDYKKFNRWKTFWQNRIDDEGDITSYHKTYYKKTNIAKLRTVDDLIDTTPTWKIVGPEKFPEGTNPRGIIGIGRITAIAVNPKDKNNVFIGAYTGGIWETKDISKINPVWECLTNNLPVTTVNNLKIVNNTLFAATSNLNLRGHQGLYKYGLGVIKKKLNSKVWQLPNKEFECVNFAISKNHENVMYAIGDKSIYKSTDSGDNWSKLADPIANINNSRVLLTNIEINPFDDNKIIISGRLYVYKLTNNKQLNTLIFQSNDAGKTWLNKTNALENYINKKIGDSKVRDKPISLTKGLNNHVTANTYKNKTYICVQKMYYPSHVYFIELDKKWEGFNLVNTISKQNNYHYTTDNVDATFKMINESIIFMGNRNLRVIDNELHKTITVDRYFKYLHQDIREIHYDENLKRLIVGTDGGINISYNKEGDYKFKEFTNVSGNLNLFLAFNMSYINKNGTKTIRIGTQDTGYYKSDNVNGDWGNWNRFGPFGEGSVYTDPNDANILYLINAGGHGGNILKSVNNGANFKNVKVKVGSYASAPLGISKVNKNYLIFDEFKNYDQYTLTLSNDQLKTTTNISKGIKELDYGVNLAIKISKKNPKTFYVARKDVHLEKYGINNALYKSENLDFENPSNISYINLTSNILKTDSIITKRAFITDIEVNDNDEKELWVSFGNLEHGKKIYHSKDGGVTWVNLSVNLPNVPVNVLKYDAANGYLYAGNDYGVYEYNNLSKSWGRYGKNLPVAIVTSLEIDNISKEIIAATQGRSVWITSIKTKENFVVNKDEKWNANKIIKGDLIISEGVSLKLENIVLKCANIVLKEGASLFSFNSKLISNNKAIKGNSLKTKITANKNAIINIENTGVNNYSVFLKDKSNFISKKNVVLKQAEVHVLKGGNYIKDKNEKLTLRDKNSKIIFSQGSKMNSKFISDDTDVFKFCGKGSIELKK